MILSIKNDNGEVIQELKLSGLVGVGFMDIPNCKEKIICTIFEGVGTPEVTYANKFLEGFINMKMAKLLQDSTPIEAVFNELPNNKVN